MTVISPCQQQVTALIAEVLNVDAASLGPNPSVYRTPGWDSLATIEIVARIEDSLGISLPDSLLTSTIDLQSIVAVACGSEFKE